MFKHIDDEVTRDGFTLRAHIKHDGDTGAPWEEHDGHGPVSDWRRRTLEEQANHFANLAGRPVEIQTYGESTYHATRRFLGQPREGGRG